MIKKNTLKFLLITFILIFFNACNKENPSQSDSEEIRLLSLTYIPLNSPGDSSRIVLNYDRNFRFAGFDYYFLLGKEPVFNNYGIYYNDNYIITNYSTVRTFPIELINFHKDTLILDVFSNPIQEKRWSVRSLINDTLNYKGYYSNVKNYTYQPSGLFSGMKEYYYDSLVEKEGNENYNTNTFNTTVFISTVSSENLVSMNIERHYRTITKNLRTNSSTTTQSSSSITREYFYTSNNPYPPSNTYNYLMNDYFPFDIYQNARKNFKQ